MEKIIGLIIFVSLLIFGVYFLEKGKLGAGTFITFMSVTLICGLAFYGFDRLKELDIKNLRMILGEMKETKKDIVKEVDVLLETLADSNISSAIETGRFPDTDLQYEMIRKREKAKELLKKAGWKEGKIKEKTDKINLYLLGDIADTIRSEASKELQGKTTEAGEPMHLKFQEEFPAIRKNDKFGKESIEEVKKYLKEYGISEEQFKPTFDNMEYFIDTGQLKRSVRN